MASQQWSWKEQLLSGRSLRTCSAAICLIAFFVLLFGEGHSKAWWLPRRAVPASAGDSGFLSRLFTSTAEEASKKAQADHTPSLFCFSVVLPNSTEVKLMRHQFQRGRVGIYSCEDWSLYSNESIRLAVDSESEAWTSVLPGGELRVDHYTFYRLWNKILGERRALAHDWTVKLDADAVFFPSRLRSLLRDKWAPYGKTDDTIILRHCYSRVVPLYPDANRGPILVLSQQALHTYQKQVEGCPQGTNPSELQESRCLQGFGAETTAVDAFGLLSEVAWACDAAQQPSSSNVDSGMDALQGEATYGCFAPAVAFHPFKSVEKWFDCRGQAEAVDL